MRDSGGMDPAEAGGRLASRNRSGFCPRFFVDHDPPWPESPRGGASSVTEIVLEVEDSRHALKVLRMRAGDRCEVVTPSGRVFTATVSAATDPVRVAPVALLEGAAAGAVYRTRVGVAQALARPSVMDYAIEKGTEVGAGFFLIVPAAGSPRMGQEAKADRLKRWKRVAREAAKQSRQTAVPWVAIADSVADGVDYLERNGALMLVLDPGAPHDLSRALRTAVGAREISGERPLPDRGAWLALWVGPEGGWTDAELSVIVSSGALPARLGRGVLRAETAGPVGVAVARLELGDW